MALKKVIITIPTYKEAENIDNLLRQILAICDRFYYKYDFYVLVIDDNSPDGTAEKVRLFNDPRVDCMIRTVDRGRGYAGRSGFIKALDLGADYIIEMDADLSHDPRFIPGLLRGLETHDLVLGSRQIAGGKQIGRPWYRRVITYLANLYIRWVFWISVRDCNSGFRAYTRSALEKINVATLKAKGPDIVQEILFRARGLKILEVPILFYERQKGKSSLTFKKVLWGYLTVLRLRFGR